MAATKDVAARKPLRPAFNDRGPARHFHGRDGDRRSFARVLAGIDADPQNSTTFLVQGPPGVGKTALLHKLAEESTQGGWRVVHIDPEVLESPAAMAQTLEKRIVQSMDRELNADLKLTGGKMSYSIAGLQSVVGVLRKYVDKDHKVALILDEAQHLATPSSAEAAASIRSVLNRITNGNVGRKVVLLLGGLSHTWDALRNRGLSRLRLNCVRDLEALKAEESRRVVRDWLMEDGCSPDHIEAWTDELADAAENWPQHIVCCVAAALDYFDAYGDRPTASAIRSVLKSADEDKYAFYSARAAGLDTDDIAILGMAAGACGLNAIFETGELLDVPGVRKRDGAARTWLGAFQAQGVLANRAGGTQLGPGSKRMQGYYVPIPSMERYLVAQAIGFAAHQPVYSHEIWEKVRGVLLRRRGRIAAEMQDHLQWHFINPDAPRKEVRNVLMTDAVLSNG
ncbi:MAG: ATP-binding protein [Bacteroidota bacterium]|nr:ATP-binding protein [Bacteroidota bacterium]